MTHETETARDMTERLAAAGLTGPALEIAVRAGAPARHEARVEATMEAARVEGATRQQIARPAAESHLAAAAVIAVDLGGIGGRFGAGAWIGEGEPATDRWLNTLGKGRWHASDGEAYAAAAHEALGRLVVGAVQAYQGQEALTASRVLVLTPEPGGVRVRLENAEGAMRVEPVFVRLPEAHQETVLRACAWSVGAGQDRLRLGRARLVPPALADLSSMLAALAAPADGEEQWIDRAPPLGAIVRGVTRG